MNVEIDSGSADGDEVGRQFRVNDNLGDESNVLLRPLRQLFEDRKPPGTVTPLCLLFGDQETFPFGSLYTGKNRLSFWPAYPKDTLMTGLRDHLTLELPSGKSHWTGFDAEGKRFRISGDSASLRLHIYVGSGLSWWFSIALRWDVLLNQHTAFQRRVDGKSAAGKEHATREFVNYAKGLGRIVKLQLPPQASSPNYVVCNVYIVTDPAGDRAFTPEMFHFDHASASIESYPQGAQFEIQGFAKQVRQHEFIFACALPPGEMKASTWVGLPKRRQLQY